MLQSAHGGNLGGNFASSRASIRAGSPAGAHGTVAPRALVNLVQRDAHLVFAGSPDYKPGEVTLMETQIRHETRGHGR